MTDFFQIISAKITAFVTVVIITITSILPGATSHVNKSSDTSIASSSATASLSGSSPSANPVTTPPLGEKQIPKKTPNSSTTPSPSPQKAESVIQEKIWELQNEPQKNNQLKKQPAESPTPTPTPQLIQIPKTTPSPTPVENSQNGITSLSFKTYWHGEIVFDYFITVCFPTSQEVVWGKIYLVNSNGVESLVSNTDFRNPPCAQTGAIGNSLKANGFNELGTYTLKIVIDNPSQIRTATSTIGPPQ